MSNNFYNAIKHTTGDIIFLCDQDDIWFPYKTRVMVECFKIENVGCINSSFQYIDSNGEEMKFDYPTSTSNNGLILHNVREGALDKIPLPLVIEKNISPGMTMAFTSKIKSCYLKYSKKSFLHDWEINCMSARLDCLYYLNTILTYYRIHGEQSVSIGNIRKRRRRDILFRKIKEAKGRADSKCRMLCEISGIEGCYDNYLKDATTLYQLILKVVGSKKVHLWFKELIMYLQVKHIYGYMDHRYCFIDLMASMRNFLKLN